MKTYRCPRCGSEVTPNDINVAKDIMLCPSCGETSSFAKVVAKSREAMSENEGLRILSAPPPKHLKVVSDPTDISGRITLVYRKISPMALFLVPFTCAWAVGVSRRFTYDHQTKIEYGETNYTAGGHHGQGGHPLGELHLNQANSSDTIHICAGMSEDALDYVAAVLRREARTI